ncbi:hypothetical protein CERSUDRAFT_76653 [Gelatoporia subvermispora B]|uniref:Uncharacterized protein n=1 Tax=Ceriporiopsis subvermispora (strain B) TaxID=914234 RepID=M2Q9A6_CERS8|nr:hypothetical protein CERSUDRAFT_76653 [Gelatoporia subvermispora B]
MYTATPTSLTPTQAAMTSSSLPLGSASRPHSFPPSYISPSPLPPPASAMAHTSVLTIPFRDTDVTPYPPNILSPVYAHQGTTIVCMEPLSGQRVYYSAETPMPDPVSNNMWSWPRPMPLGWRPNDIQEEREQIRDVRSQNEGEVASGRVASAATPITFASTLEATLYPRIDPETTPSTETPTSGAGMYHMAMTSSVAGISSRSRNESQESAYILAPAPSRHPMACPMIRSVRMGSPSAARTWHPAALHRADGPVPTQTLFLDCDILMDESNAAEPIEQ